ncbi:SusF/SusE family outer membrane protein [Thermophagus sp. OGC60D27]|uniref:SusF/SusE family outer membrane protein n=1 Tax=Thermophagus sp. OGC60D27 TaxID=3458415 RepID=UPI004038092E
MKRKNIYGSLFVVLLMTIIGSSCTEDMSEVRLDPAIETTQSMGISSDSAVIEGFVLTEGTGFTERGVCYSTTENPTVDDNKVEYTGDTDKAAFNVTLRGLDYATPYYARAYGIGPNGVVYGEQMSFTTLPVVPTVTTMEIVSDITGNSAKSGGEVTVAGGAEVTARGVCFSTEENPTIEDQKTDDGEGLGEFVSTLTGLKGNTIYYVRAYATNSAGTGYGLQVTFKTPVDAPVVVTSSIDNVTKTSAIINGEVTYDGGGTVTARGFVWGTSENPTLEDNVLNSGDGVGVIVEELTELEMNTTYYVRAFATNEYGTAYGENISFTTLADITKFWIVGNYNEWDNSDNAEFIISTAESNGLAEGYVYLTAGEIKLTTDHSWDDAHTFGDDGSGGLTNPGNNIPVPADGYYRIQANLSDMTYSLIAMQWGVVGNATPNGWDVETLLTYDSSLKVLKGAFHFTVGEFKFRANGSWDYNYGSDAADGTLSAGGENIPVDFEADYAVTLDLSTPNEYKYSAHRWGVIGSATPGEWSTDTDMTWDETNQVFTATLDMVVGEFKFRADDAWDYDLGGDINALTPGGANMAIEEAGNYTITLDPWNNTATLTKN